MKKEVRRLVYAASYLALVSSAALIQFACSSSDQEQSQAQSASVESKANAYPESNTPKSESDLGKVHSSDGPLMNTSTSPTNTKPEFFDNDDGTLEAKVAGLEARIKNLEDSQQQVAFIDAIKAFESDEVFKEESKKLRERVAEERDKLDKEFSKLFGDARSKIRVNSVGSVAWREGQKALLKHQLAKLDKWRKVQADLEKEGDETLIKVFKRLQNATKTVCEREGIAIVINLRIKNLKDNESVAAIGSLLRQSPVLYYEGLEVADGKCRDITTNVVEVMKEQE